jgi:hypothetical protein
MTLSFAENIAITSLIMSFLVILLNIFTLIKEHDKNIYIKEILFKTSKLLIEENNKLMNIRLIKLEKKIEALESVFLDSKINCI